MSTGQCSECGSFEECISEYTQPVNNLYQFKISFTKKRMTNNGGCMGLEPATFCPDCLAFALADVADVLQERQEKND